MKRIAKAEKAELTVIQESMAHFRSLDRESSGVDHADSTTAANFSRMALGMNLRYNSLQPTLHNILAGRPPIGSARVDHRRVIQTGHSLLGPPFILSTPTRLSRITVIEEDPDDVLSKHGPDRPD